jgi:hypothetical protein
MCPPSSLMLLNLPPVLPCPPLALFLSAAVIACLCFVGLFCLVVDLDVAVLSLLRPIRRT